MPKNDNAGLDLQEYHDGARLLAEQVRAAENEWLRRKAAAKAAKDTYDEAVDALVAYTAEDSEPETPLLGPDD